MFRFIKKIYSPFCSLDYNRFLNLVAKYTVYNEPFIRLSIPCLFTFSWIGWCIFLKQLQKKLEYKSPINLIQEFVHSRKEIFLSFCESREKNKNIHPDLYDYEKYQNILKDESNTLEKEWKARVLYDTTPSGNLIMYYDVFKHCFVYFSDQTISYSVLSASAMKYCRIYFCKDFFRDNFYTKDKQLSPFTQMDLDQEKREKEKKEEKRKKINLDFNSDAFLKPKPKPESNLKKGEVRVLKSSINDKTGSLLEKEKEKEKEINYYKNIFQNMGKINNFKLLQKSAINFKQKKIDSYAKFKESLRKKKMESTQTIIRVPIINNHKTDLDNYDYSML